MDKTTLVVVAVSFIILIGGALVFASTRGGADANEGVELADKVKGNPEASVTLAEYSDFQCPACRSFVPAIDEIMSEYGDQLRFEYHHFPLISIHPSAELAARASEAAGVQGQFWEYHDILFERQPEWSNSINPRNLFVGYAEELGLNVDDFRRHLGASIIRDAVQEDMREARTLNLTGTPTFLLNGERMEITTFEDFRRQIEVALGVTADAPEASAPAATTDVEFGF